MTANHRVLDAADVTLIDQVKATPSLYDSTSADFKFAYRKEQLWENVANAMGMPAIDARRRWTCLRDRYSRELKQMRLHPEKSEYGNNDFFRQMDFLRKFVRRRRERRRDMNYKYDSSWDGSNDDINNKINHRLDLTVHSREDIYDDTQDQYDAKIAVSTTETTTDNYAHFVGGGQMNDEYDGYAESHPAESTSLMKYSNSPSVTTRHQSQCGNGGGGGGGGSSGGPSAMPMNFVNTTASGNNYGLHKSSTPRPTECGITAGNETEDDFFCKTVGSYLRHLSRRHKIKAKVEMFQILEKYIELEENADMCRHDRKG